MICQFLSIRTSDCGEFFWPRSKAKAFLRKQKSCTLLWLCGWREIVNNASKMVSVADDKRQNLSFSQSVKVGFSYTCGGLPDSWLLQILKWPSWPFSFFFCFCFFVAWLMLFITLTCIKWTIDVTRLCRYLNVCVLNSQMLYRWVLWNSTLWTSPLSCACFPIPVSMTLFHLQGYMSLKK